MTDTRGGPLDNKTLVDMLRDSLPSSIREGIGERGWAMLRAWSEWVGECEELDAPDGVQDALKVVALAGMFDDKRTRLALDLLGEDYGTVMRGAFWLGWFCAQRECSTVEDMLKKEVK